MTIKTKWDVYKELKTEFYHALPQVAIECDVSISEAQCDRCNDKRYIEFRKVIYSDFKGYEQGKKDERDRILKYVVWISNKTMTKGQMLKSIVNEIKEKELMKE